jgi:hypothetical protein
VWDQSTRPTQGPTKTSASRAPHGAGHAARADTSEKVMHRSNPWRLTEEGTAQLIGVEQGAMHRLEADVGLGSGRQIGFWPGSWPGEQESFSSLSYGRRQALQRNRADSFVEWGSGWLSRE